MSCIKCQSAQLREDGYLECHFYAPEATDGYGRWAVVQPDHSCRQYEQNLNRDIARKPKDRHAPGDKSRRGPDVEGYERRDTPPSDRGWPEPEAGALEVLPPEHSGLGG